MEQSELSAPNRRGAALARKLIVDLSVMVGIGIVLALMAPLGTSDMGFMARLGYWLLVGIIGYFCYNPIGIVMLRFGPRLDLPEWFLWVLAVLLATVPMAMLVWIINQYPGPYRWPGMEGAALHYLSVLVIGAVITVFFNLLPATRRTGPVGAAPAAAVDAAPVDAGPVDADSVSARPISAGPASVALVPDGPVPAISSPPALPPPAPPPPALPPPAQPLPTPPARFMDRLPSALGSDLIALEMEDHYVRAHTALGSELVLMRMRDAVSELGDLEGKQVHRSWWVARGAVEDVRREGRNIRLLLAGELVAPVARANVSALKEAGWI